MRYLKPASIHPALDPLVSRLRELGAQRVILYGSRARGDNLNPRADIDLAVDAPGIDDRVWHKMQEVVENVQTLLEIDLLRLQGASVDLTRNVLKDGVSLQ